MQEIASTRGDPEPDIQAVVPHVERAKISSADPFLSARTRDRVTVRARSARASRLRDQVSRTYNRDSEEAPLWAILLASMFLPCVVILIGYAAAKMGEAVAIVLVVMLVPFIVGHTLAYVRHHQHHAP